MTLPRDALAFEYQPDPADLLDFAFDATALLGRADIAPGFTVTLSADGLALGLSIVTDAAHAPALSSDGGAIVFWIAVDPARAGDPAFDGGGAEIGVTIDFSTDDVPPRRFERTLALTVRNR